MWSHGKRALNECNNTFNVMRMKNQRGIFEAESNWKLWHLPFLHWNKIYGSRIRKPNPLHFVFLIWIKFYDTIKCLEYYIEVCRGPRRHGCHRYRGITMWHGRTSQQYIHHLYEYYHQPAVGPSDSHYLRTLTRINWHYHLLDPFDSDLISQFIDTFVAINAPGKYIFLPIWTTTLSIVRDILHLMF